MLKIKYNKYMLKIKYNKYMLKLNIIYIIIYVKN